jgi:hypothetical protein
LEGQGTQSTETDYCAQRDVMLANSQDNDLDSCEDVDIKEMYCTCLETLEGFMGLKRRYHNTIDQLSVRNRAPTHQALKLGSSASSFYLRPNPYVTPP